MTGVLIMEQNQGQGPSNGPDRTNLPINPLTNGKAGKSSAALIAAGVVCVCVLVIADTIQFVATGHESGLFLTLEKVAGTVSLAGLVGALFTTWIKGRAP